MTRAATPVGTIQAIQTTSAVLATGTVNVRVPLDVITAGPRGPTIPLTKAEVEARAKAGTTSPQ
jgi:hypothetical protein